MGGDVSSRSCASYRLSPLWGVGAADDRYRLCQLHIPSSAIQQLVGQKGGMWKGPRPKAQKGRGAGHGAMWRNCSPGKGHKDENFPVASFLIAPRPIVPPVFGFLQVRYAPPTTSRPTIPPRRRKEKNWALLEQMARQPGGRERFRVRRCRPCVPALAERGPHPRPCIGSVGAFSPGTAPKPGAIRTGMIWSSYCRYSAMPVGRFVLGCARRKAGICGPPMMRCCARAGR